MNVRVQNTGGTQGPHCGFSQTCDPPYCKILYGKQISWCFQSKKYKIFLKMRTKILAFPPQEGTFIGVGQPSTSQ